LPIARRVALLAADGDLVPLLVVLVDAEDADVGDVVVAAGVHAARDVERDVADVVEIVEVVELLVDGLGDRDRRALASAQRSPPGQQIMSVSRPMLAVARPAAAGDLPDLVQIALAHVGEDQVLFVADAQFAEAETLGEPATAIICTSLMSPGATPGAFSDRVTAA
jgi:hypothetical protein